MTRNHKGMLFALLLAAASACSDVSLICISELCSDSFAKAANDRITVTGEVCTSPPAPVLYPYKILFVIDVSGSNIGSDPTGNRGQAARRVIDNYIKNPAVSFGGIVFNGPPEDPRARRVHSTFTRDYELLVPDAVDAFNEANEGTPYTEALNETLEFLRDDLRLTPEHMWARTRYDIQWLSDGRPTDGTTRADAEAYVEELRGLREDYGLFDITLSTVALVGAGLDDEARTILTSMAQVGGGSYQELTGSDLDFQIRFTEIVRRFEERQFLLVNHSRVVVNSAILADSDRDGLEDIADPDPLVPDADNDWCDDRVEHELAGNPDLCAAICDDELQETKLSRPVDSDQDGLYDCVEKAMGFHQRRFDSDFDGFFDGLELRFRANPHDENPFVRDTDKDGFSDGDEIVAGTDPSSPEPEAQRRYKLAYRYSPMQQTSTEDGVSCFAFSVDNVRLAHTEATVVSREGDNLVCAYLSQTPIDDPISDHTVIRACGTARYLATEQGEVRVPALGVLELKATDFSRVGR